ncbi:MAG: M24 family metallopeptidase [Candidatus Aminicenantales bacterium]
MPNSKKVCTLFLFLVLIHIPVSSAKKGMPAVLNMKERAAVVDEWLRIRLEKVLPEIMRRENLDMWIIICREYNEDPVYLSLVPFTSLSARRLTMLVFYDRGREGVERLAVSRYGIGNFYKTVWEPEKMDQWECLARVVKEREPQRIGINESETFAFGDGISASLKKKLMDALGPEYTSRLHSAENLAVRWLETRIPEELEVYPHIVSLAHHIIAEAFSPQVITPGVTTAEDVVWWMRERIRKLKLTTWFQPSVSIQRPRKNSSEGNVIHRGDLLHCDVGITYLRLSTDTQEHAYVLKEDENNCPQGLRDALRMGNRLQDILIGEFQEGRTGNEILASALKKARAEGLKASIYTHPLGYHGHGAGPTIGLWDKQDGVPGKGDYPLHYNTCHSIELNIRTNIPEWGRQEVRIALEQDAVFTRDGVYFLDGRQTRLHMIK